MTLITQQHVDNLSRHLKEEHGVDVTIKKGWVWHVANRLFNVLGTDEDAFLLRTATHIGRTIYLPEGDALTPPTLLRILVHEGIHIRDMAHMGRFGYAVRYAVEVIFALSLAAVLLAAGVITMVTGDVVTGALITLIGVLIPSLVVRFMTKRGCVALETKAYSGSLYVREIQRGGMTESARRRHAAIYAQKLASPLYLWATSDTSKTLTQIVDRDVPKEARELVEAAGLEAI